MLYTFHSNTSYETFKIDFKSDELVSNVKHKLCEMNQAYEFTALKLIHQGTFLEDNMTLDSYQMDLSTPIAVIQSKKAGSNSKTISVTPPPSEPELESAIKSESDEDPYRIEITFPEVPGTPPGYPEDTVSRDAANYSVAENVMFGVANELRYNMDTQYKEKLNKELFNTFVELLAAEYPGQYVEKHHCHCGNCFCVQRADKKCNTVNRSTLTAVDRTIDPYEQKHMFTPLIVKFLARCMRLPVRSGAGTGGFRSEADAEARTARMEAWGARPQLLTIRELWRRCGAWHMHVFSENVNTLPQDILDNLPDFLTFLGDLDWPFDKMEKAGKADSIASNDALFGDGGQQARETLGDTKVNLATEDALIQLQNMGIEAGNARTALEAAGGDISKAMAFIFGD